MDTNKSQNEKQAFVISLISFYLGVGSVIALIVAILMAILIDDIGLVSSLKPVMILALSALISGLIVHKKIRAENLKGHNTARIGMIIGAVVIAIIIILRISIFIFFLLWLQV